MNIIDNRGKNEAETMEFSLTDVVFMRCPSFDGVSSWNIADHWDSDKLQYHPYSVLASVVKNGELLQQFSIDHTDNEKTLLEDITEQVEHNVDEVDVILTNAIDFSEYDWLDKSVELVNS